MFGELQHFKATDEKGEILESFKRLLIEGTIPQNYLLDREGKVIAINIYGEELIKKLEELTKKKWIYRYVWSVPRRDKYIIRASKEGYSTEWLKWPVNSAQDGAGYLSQGRHQFNDIVVKYRGNYRVRNLTCYDQLLVMCLAQYADKNSLRDIEPIPELFNKPINNAPKDDGQLDLFRDIKS